MMNDKIRKLLALSTSDNEHEAEVAITKLREFMAKESKERAAKYAENEDEKIVEIRTDIKFSLKRSPWVVDLSKMIAKRYGIVTYQIRKVNGVVYTVVLFGQKRNVDRAEQTLRAVYDTLIENRKKFKTPPGNFQYEYDYIRALNKKLIDESEREGKQGGIALGILPEAQERLDAIKKETIRRERKRRTPANTDEL